MRWCLVPLVFANLAGAQEYRLTREGQYWIRVESGTFSIPPSGKIKFVSPGRIRTQGEWRQDIGYVLKTRVRAKDVVTAKKLLERGGIHMTQRGGWGYLEVQRVPGRFEPPELEIHLPRRVPQVAFQTGGDGEVAAFDLDSPVSVDAQAGSVQLDRIRGAVTARTGGGEIRLGRIGGAIRCVSGGGGIFVEGAQREAVLETVGGEVFVREAFGPVTANTGGGNIQILRAMSTVNAHTNGGLVDVNQANGMVNAVTSAGAIHVGSAAGARCESAGGTIQLEAVSGAVEAATLRGSILAGISGNKLADSFLNASSGDITVFLPSRLAVTVQAESEAAGRIGTILSDFPEIRVWSALLNGRPIQAGGTLNGGGPLLRLSATGGVIYLKRQK